MMVEACFELAKIHEHRLKDYDLAIEYCQKAIALVNQFEKPPKITSQFTLEQLQVRLKRLEQKYAK
jgi:hypothetical protein